MIPVLPIDLIKDAAKKYKLDWTVLAAMACRESGGKYFQNRYEPQTLKYVIDVDKHARACGITKATEQINQMNSWGIMQTMGFKCRELGFKDAIPSLCLPHISLDWACRVIMHKIDHQRLTVESDIIAAYNRGSVKKLDDGTYANQEHVTAVLGFLKEIRGGIK